MVASGPQNNHIILPNIGRVFIFYDITIYMQIIIENINENLASALRRCGYHFEREHKDSGEVSAARNLARSRFPRFHCYAKLNGSDMEINLHLDQKKPSYEGSKAHAGEYAGEIVEEEAKRIKSILLLSQ